MTSPPPSIPHRPTLTPAATAPAGVPVEVADSIAACQRLREPWLRLRERCGVQSPNTDPDRFLAVVGALADARPHVVVIGPPESPRAMIVARRSRRRVAYRIGYVTFHSPTLQCLDVVYEGLLTDGQRNSVILAFTHLGGCLRRRDFDIVSFNHLRLEQAHSVMAHARRAVLDPPALHWRFELVPGSFDKTMARFSNATRRRRQRADRHLVKHFDGQVNLRLFTQVEELDELLPRAAQITAQSYHGRLGVGLHDEVVMRAMLSADAGAGRLRWYWLEARGKPIAHDGGCIYGDTYHAIAGSFLPQYRRLSPGQVLLIRVIENLCTAGVRWIDWGFGDAEYKRIYGTESWAEQRVSLYGRTARATVAWALDVARLRLENLFRAGVVCLGCLQWVKTAWRRRMTCGSDS